MPNFVCHNQFSLVWLSDTLGEKHLENKERYLEKSMNILEGGRKEGKEGRMKEGKKKEVRTNELKTE